MYEVIQNTNAHKKESGVYMSFEIVTDSCCNLPDELIEKYNLNILSLVFLVEGKEYNSYIKGEKSDLKQFYTMMRNKEHITTSCINADVCQKMFTSLLDAGKDILYIGFSSGLSATYQTAHLVLEELREKYPDQKIYDVDTLSAAMGQGLIVHYAAKMRDNGDDIETVANWLTDNRLNLAHWFTVDDLFFLMRGGRVSKTAAVFGSMLGIKPVLHVDDEGHLVPVSKVRGRKAALNALVDKMCESAIGTMDVKDQTVYISHGDCIADAEYVASCVRERLGVEDIVMNCLDPVIGAHAGPGTVALFFLANKR